MNNHIHCIQGGPPSKHKLQKAKTTKLATGTVTAMLLLKLNLTFRNLIKDTSWN